MRREDQVKTDQTWATLQAVPFHIIWHVWWIGTLMFVWAQFPPWCPCVALQLKSSCQATNDEKPAPFNYEGPPRDCCYFASLFHVRSLCAPSVCRFEWRLNDGFPLRTWHITLMPSRPAGWEKTAAARHSSQPHQSQRRQTWRPELPEKPVRWHLFFLSHSREKLTDWMTDWGGKYAKRQAESDLMDRIGVLVSTV